MKNLLLIGLMLPALFACGQKTPAFSESAPSSEFKLDSTASVLVRRPSVHEHVGMILDTLDQARIRDMLLAALVATGRIMSMTLATLVDAGVRGPLP